MEATPNAFNIDGIPVEVNENSYPVLVERLELIPDSAGAGRHRAGHGVRKDVRILGDDVTLTNLTDRQRFAPPGVLGGDPGALGRTMLNVDGPDPRVLESKGTYKLEHGDLVTTWLAGGGGYGEAIERDVELVRRDVLHGLLSPAKAASAYGVVIDAAGEVDHDATERRRNELRATEGTPA